MRNRWMTALAIAGLALGAACDDDPDDETAFGEYAISVIENRDTCDGTHNDFGSTLVVTNVEGQVQIAFGGFPAIPATLDSEGGLNAQGVVEESEDGTTTLRLTDVFFFRGGSVEGNGILTLDGTFPDPEAPQPCFQEFTFTGRKSSASVTPVLPTAPTSR